MSEMVERITQVLANAQDGLRDEGLARSLAKAVIEAMRQPTEEIRSAGASVVAPGHVNLPLGCPDCAESIWRAMIDEALKERPNEDWRRQHARGK